MVSSSTPVGPASVTDWVVDDVPEGVGLWPIVEVPADGGYDDGLLLGIERLVKSPGGAGRKLARLIREAGHTQERFADLVEMDVRHLRRHLREGSLLTKLTTLSRIADALGMTVPQLIRLL